MVPRLIAVDALGYTIAGALQAGKSVPGYQRDWWILMVLESLLPMGLSKRGDGTTNRKGFFFWKINRKK